MQKIYYRTIYYILLGIISTPVSRDTRPNVQMYVQIVQRSVEIERQIAKDHNSLDPFKKKWSRLKPPLFKRMYLSAEVNCRRRSVD